MCKNTEIYLWISLVGQIGHWLRTFCHDTIIRIVHTKCTHPYIVTSVSTTIHKSTAVIHKSCGFLLAEKCTCMHCGTFVNEPRILTWKSLFCFYLHTKSSRSCIKLRLKHWCHMDYFNDVLTTFLGLKHGGCVAVYVRSGSSLISPKMSWFVFRSWTNVLRVCNCMRVSN